MVMDVFRGGEGYNEEKPHERETAKRRNSGGGHHPGPCSSGG
jgi:hypothetical protein